MFHPSRDLEGETFEIFGSRRNKLLAVRGLLGRSKLPQVLLHVSTSNVLHDNVKGIFNSKVKHPLKSINWTNCNICKNHCLNASKEYDARYDTYLAEYNIPSNLQRLGGVEFFSLFLTHDTSLPFLSPSRHLNARGKVWIKFSNLVDFLLKIFNEFLSTYHM